MKNEERKREFFLQIQQPPELRSEGDGPTRIAGYAAVFDVETPIWWFRERIAAGAFTRTLKEKPDVRALFDHDSGMPIGRTTNGSLKLVEDERGLFTEITPPDTTLGRDTLENVRSGLVTGMSFGFNVITDEWGMKDGKELRTIKDVELWEVSVVTFPAYEATSATARSVGSIYRDPREVYEEQKQKNLALRHQHLKNRIALYERLL